jgi:hypothetical protein
MHFQECRSARDVKRTFNRISRELHPDKGGTKESFIELFDQYQEAKQQFPEITARGETKTEEKSFHEEAEPGIQSRSRWWAKLSQQELWDHIKAEQEANNKAVERQNQDCLEHEKTNEERSYSKRDRAFLKVNYDTLGSVAEMFVFRKAQSMESLLAEMKGKRECGPSFQAPAPPPPPPYSFKAPPPLRSLPGRNKRKRTIERERWWSEEGKREP